MQDDVHAARGARHTHPMLQLATDLATELEARDELLAACREVLATTGNGAASALVQHIDALLDLGDDDENDERRPEGRRLTYC